jgi:hypothetical protein
VAALVCGLIGLVFCQLGGIPAVICGHRARKQIRESDGAETGDAMALAGLILGYISIGIMVFFLVFVIVLIAATPK